MVPVIGGGALLLFLLLIPRFSRISYNLWNSGIATISAGFLLRGIINLSGRSTTLDHPYWYIGGGLLSLAIIFLLFTFAQSEKRTSSMEADIDLAK